MKLPAAPRTGSQSGIAPLLTRLRSEELRRGSPRHFIGSKPKAKTEYSLPRPIWGKIIKKLHNHWLDHGGRYYGTGPDQDEHHETFDFT